MKYQNSNRYLILTLHSNIGWKYYLLFIILSGISIIVIGFLWPDTNGVPLEEISRLFGVSNILVPRFDTPMELFI
jgi:hypothetical protein